LNQQEGDMGLLDAVAGAIGGGGGGQGDLMQLVMKLVQDNGGLEGLVSKFQQGGLGEVVQSWVSTGPNLPISPEQLGQALGLDTLSQLGAGGQDLLGQVVDGLTPGGQLPASGGDLGAVLGSLLGGAGGAGAGGPNLGGLLGGLLGKR
jgi:uncharacterized protein YidB (DUF937 family)